jgi:cytochrome P450
MQVVIDMIGVQYNPRYFDSPNEYRPSRWYGSSDSSEAFTAFSVGSRECIGRRFATTEAVCFLTLLLRDFIIRPTMHPRETREAWQNRVLDAKLGLALGVADVPVKFVRRMRTV